MSKEQKYLEIQITMGSLYRKIKELPLDETIQEVDRVTTLGPLLDPTLWMKKGEDAERWLRIMRAFRTCRNTIAKEFEKVKP